MSESQNNSGGKTVGTEKNWQSLSEESGATADSQPKLKLRLGYPLDKENSLVTLTPEDFFGRHCAIVGSSGSGKSWSMARMIEEASRFNSRIILLDASGEFMRLDSHTLHLCVGGKKLSEGTSVAVPYYHLRECDLFAVFSPSGPSQGPKLRAAIQSLKLARHAPMLAPDGTIQKAYRTKVEYESAQNEFIAELEGPYCDFDVKKLPLQIQLECVDPQRSPVEPLVWGGPNGLEMSHCVSLINRIQDMVNSPNLASLFQPGTQPSLFNEVAGFLKQSRYRVLRISLEHLPFEHNTREIIGNAIGRYLLELGRAGIFKEKPLVVCLDEAHQFLSNLMREANEHYPLDAFSLMSKEGRKYALNLCLATQRPSDIPSNILSQMGTFLVHRLTNSNDLAIIETASGLLAKDSLNSIPSLVPGEAMLVGICTQKPMLIKMLAPEQRPESEGPDYQARWK